MLKYNISKWLLLFILLFTALSFSACGRFLDFNITEFRFSDDGLLITPSGEEYSFLANEGILYYFGDLVYEGTALGEEGKLPSMIYAIKGDNIKNILIRISPDSEWFSVYRRASLPPLDTALENCVRLEFVPGGYFTRDIVHASCGVGITDPVQISDFLAHIRSQKDPHEAGLYDRITKPDGFLENCYVCGMIYGFFDEEPLLAFPLQVQSFNDLAYSVSIHHEGEYVLPEKWMSIFQDMIHTEDPEAFLGDMS